MGNSIKFIPIIISAFLLASCSNEITFPDGGYAYPAHPYKSKKDSFIYSYYGKYWYKALDEPDLTIKPLKQTIVRLHYGTAFGKSVILSMTQTEIVVKEEIQGKYYPENDSMKLSQLERLHYFKLQRYFPFQEVEINSPIKIKVDSMARIYPKLLNPTYYKYLLDKSAKFDTVPFKYSVKTLKISQTTYRRILNQINSSGFWKLPLKIECGVDYADGDGILLEINAPDKYNSVSLSNCYGKELKFSKACQALIDAAKLVNKIKLVSED